MAKKPVDKKTAAPAKEQKEKKPNRVVKFLKDLKAEVGKIVWPSRKTVLNNTGVVLTIMIIGGIFIWGFDFGLSALLDLFL